jgi:hypothetical protein
MRRLKKESLISSMITILLEMSAIHSPILLQSTETES